MLSLIRDLFGWIDKQIEWFKSFLQEPGPDGKGSIKRVIMLLIAIAFLMSYYETSMVNEYLVDVPLNWLILLGSTIGLGIAQNYYSRKDPNLNGGLLEKTKNLLSKKDES